jgi:replicative DNA helicase
MIDYDKKLLERVIIYNCLFDASYLQSVIEYTKPSFFEDKAIKTVYADLYNFFQIYKKIPNPTELKIHLESDESKKAFKDVLLSFSTIDKKYDKDVLLKISENFLKEKTILETVRKTYIDLESGSFNSSQILKDFEKACNISLSDSLGFDYFENIDQHCENLKKTFTTISTGWNWLDSKLGGGFQEKGKALYCFFGVTNVGKSIFLGNVATNVIKQGKTVLLISLEMSEDMYAKRISSSLSKIPSNDLAKKTDLLKEKLIEYKDQTGGKLIIKEFAPRSASAYHIKNFIHKLIRNGVNPDLIVIDYINLLSPIDHKKPKHEQIQETTEVLRGLTYEFERSIITATQANRSAFGQINPDLDSTSESLGLSTTVDAQISIWTEKDDIDLGIIHLGIAKNRFGPRQCVSILNIDYETLTLTDPDDVQKDFSVRVNKIPFSPDVEENGNTKSTLDIIQELSEVIDN